MIQLRMRILQLAFLTLACTLVIHVSPKSSVGQYLSNRSLPAGNSDSPFKIPANWQEDADLRDVCFVDEDYGWAVGDLGTIWSTQNGGEIWRAQQAGVDCQLTSVHFVDRELGWAVGGYAVPLTSRSIGVVLQTKDGGRTWQKIEGVLLPWLTRVHFSTQSVGYATGVATAVYPSGVWKTRDAGRTWSPILGVSGEHWTDADFKDKAGVLVGPSGARAWLANSRIQRADDTGDRMETKTGNSKAGNSNAGDFQAGFRRPYASLIDPQIGFAGGSKRPTLTVDAGESWLRIGAFPDVVDQLNLSTMASFGQHAWLAGSPATRILHSHDNGRNWNASNCAMMLPIHKLHFHDPNNGWAVGARGSIAKTNDGGMTWKFQHGSNRRTALLGVFADEQDIPWEMLTRASASGGYRVHIVVVASKSPPNALSCPHEFRLRDAAMRIGASAEQLSRLPLHSNIDLPPGKLMQRWESISPTAVEQLSARLTSLVRTWRPDVVVTSLLADDNRQPSGRQNLVRQLVMDACDYAESETAFPQQINQLGLAPIKVDRVLAVTAKSTATASRTSTVAAREQTTTGFTVDELAGRSARLIHTLAQPAHHKQPWTLLDLRDPERAEIGGNPMGGIAVEYNSAARRSRAIHTADITRRRGTLQKRTHSKNMLLGGGKLAGEGTLRIENARQLLNSLDKETAGEVLFEVAMREAAVGDFQETDAVLRQLVVQYGTHPLADSALQWLIVYHSSLEQAWRARSSNPATIFPNREAAGLADAAINNRDPFRGNQFQSVSRIPTHITGTNAVTKASAKFPIKTPRTIEAVVDGKISGVKRKATAGANSNAAGKANGGLGFDGGTNRDDNRDLATQESATSRLNSPRQNAQSPSEPNAIPQQALLGAEPIPTRVSFDWTFGLQLAEQLKSKRPNAYSEPSIAFPIAAISRLTGETNAAKSIMGRYSGLPASSRWRDRATAELRLIDAAAARSKSTDRVWKCVRLDEPPHLDGDLSDPCWQKAEPQPLVATTGDDETQTTNSVVLMAMDDEFLYVAAVCRKYSSATYLPKRRPRPRDPNLNQMDRLVLSLDVNRDYASWWQIQFDHRGWTSESLLDDPSWNPKYFVASAIDEENWTIEAAIPLNELAPSELLGRGQHWAIGVTRLTPGHSAERWESGSKFAAKNLPALQGLMRLQ